MANLTSRKNGCAGRTHQLSDGQQAIDLRMSTLPTQFGESVVLRVLDRSSVNLELESLGFPKSVFDLCPR